MVDNLKKFATRLKELRLEKGYSQKQLANLIDCPPSLISYYESCKRNGIYLYFGFVRVLGETQITWWEYWYRGLKKSIDKKLRNDGSSRRVVDETCNCVRKI